MLHKDHSLKHWHILHRTLVLVARLHERVRLSFVIPGSTLASIGGKIKRLELKPIEVTLDT